MPVLVIEGTGRLVVKVGITERELARIKPNQAATLVADGAASEIPAVVSSIAPAPGDDGLYAVEVAPATGREQTLHPGMLITVRFAEASSRFTVPVPLDAIVHRQDKAWVFVVAGVAPEATAHLREVEVERWDGKDGLVRSSLKDGERIVREGAYFLLDGQNVRILPSGVN